MLCNIIMNEMNDGTLRKFADSTKPRGVVGRAGHCTDLQQDPNRLRKWANRCQEAESAGSSLWDREVAVWSNNMNGKKPHKIRPCPVVLGEKTRADIEM